MRWVYIDCDDTLIMYDRDKYSDLPDVKIEDPYIKGEIETFKIHTKHVYWLKKMAKRGETIVVWSAGGAGWAEAVCKALKIKKYVSYILRKPDTIFDDTPTKDNFPPPTWMKPE